MLARNLASMSALSLYRSGLQFGLNIVLARFITPADYGLVVFTAPFLFRGGPEGARSVLSSIITAMISVTGLVFSITIVALQLSSSQFSPRILRTFLRDRITQIALGTFISTFMYALVVLRRTA